MVRPARPIALLLPVLCALVLILLGLLFAQIFPSKPHAVLIGLDGVPPEIVESMMARGELPNLARISEFGRFKKLHTHHFSHTRLVWPIIYTGVGPERNGISVDLASEFESLAITPNMRQVPAIWDYVTNAGEWAMVIAPYESYPAEQRDHVMEVSDMILNMPQISNKPENAYSSTKVMDWSIPRMNWALEDPWLSNELHFVLDGKGLNKEFSSKMAKNSTLFQITLDKILEKIKRELLSICNLGSISALQDCTLLLVYFRGTDTIQHLYNDGLPPEMHSLGRQKVEETLRLYDAALGRIIDSSPPGCYECVVSDHGFDMAPQKRVNYSLRREISGEQAQNLLDLVQKATMHGILVYTNTWWHNNILTVDINQALSYKQQISAVNYLRQFQELTPMDLGYLGDHTNGINLDLIGRYDPEATPPVGIYFLSGPGVNELKNRGTISINDVTPTLLYALGLDVPADMDGIAKLHQFKTAWVDKHPLKLIANLPARKKTGQTVQMDNSARIAEMQGLGYIDKQK